MYSTKKFPYSTVYYDEKSGQPLVLYRSPVVDIEQEVDKDCYRIVNAKGDYVMIDSGLLQQSKVSLIDILAMTDGSHQQKVSISVLPVKSTVRNVFDGA